MIDSDDRFIAVYERYYPDIYAYCRRRMDSASAEDVVAETFLTAWRKLDELPVEGREVLLWLYRVAYRSVGHQWRSASRRKDLETKMASRRHHLVPPPEDYIVQNDQARQILDAASHLRPKDLEVLRLSAWEQLPHAEIARVLEVSTDAVTQRLYRARKYLAKEINRIEGMSMRSPAAQEGGMS